MIDKEEYKRELIRMWDMQRGDEYKGKNICDGVFCEDCPLSEINNDGRDGCMEPMKVFEIIKIVEEWSKENLPKKYKASRVEYDILQEAYSIHGNFRMYQHEIINNLREKGYFKGSYEDTEIEYYLKNCEVADDEKRSD